MVKCSTCAKYVEEDSLFTQICKECSGENKLLEKQRQEIANDLKLWFEYKSVGVAMVHVNFKDKELEKVVASTTGKIFADVKDKLIELVSQNINKANLEEKK